MSRERKKKMISEVPEDQYPLTDYLEMRIESMKRSGKIADKQIKAISNWPEKEPQYKIALKKVNQTIKQLLSLEYYEQN